MQYPFEKQEFDARMSAACKEMQKRDLDVALIYSPSNIYYLTGYCAESAYIPQVLILPADGSRPTFITRDMDAITATLTSVLDEASIVGLPETYVGASDRDGFDFICERVGALGFATKRIGVEMGAGTFSAASWEKTKALLPDASFTDVTGVVTWLRLIKSPAEIAYMRQAAAISDAAMKAVVDVIGPGVRQRDAGAALLAALVKGTDAFGGDHANHPNMPAGERIKAPHLAWTDGVYNPGDPVNIELGGSRFRYTAGLSRTVSVGEPAQALKDLHATVLEGMERAFEAIKPGNLCGEVFEAFHKVIVPRGYTKSSRLGYAIGIDWLEETASLQRGDKTILVPNMTMHMICGMWEEKDIGYVLSETFRVTESGVESLAKTPRELFVKG